MKLQRPDKTRYGHHVVLCLLISIWLAACGGGGTSSQLNIGTGDLSLKFPVSLSKHLTDAMELSASLIVDGGKEIPLTVDRKNETLRGNISGLSKGRHELTVVYRVVYNATQVVVARGTIDIDVGDFEVQTLAYNAFIYLDDDHDGVTNIAEMEFGTDVLDPGSKPASHGLHGSQNYAVIDKPLNYSVVVGPTNSTNYEIQ